MLIYKILSKICEISRFLLQTTVCSRELKSTDVNRQEIVKMFYLYFCEIRRADGEEGNKN